MNKYQLFELFKEIFCTKALENPKQTSDALQLLRNAINQYPDLIYSSRTYTIDLLSKIHEISLSQLSADENLFPQVASLAISLNAPQLILNERDFYDSENPFMIKTFKLAQNVFDIFTEIDFEQLNDFRYCDPVVLIDIIAK